MMNKDEKALELLNLVHGVQTGADGERLRRWAEAFDAWLDQREAQFNPKLRKASKRAWRSFLSFVGKVPWEVDEGDGLAWTKYLQEQGRTKITIGHKLTKLSKFFDHCIEKEKWF